jgi:hypothetical protein
MDLDFSNIHAYPPAKFSGIIVLRLSSQSHALVDASIRRMLALLSSERLSQTLWIVEETRIRIHE